MHTFTFIGYDKNTFTIKSFYLDRINREYIHYNFKNIQIIINEFKTNPFLKKKDIHEIEELYIKNLKIKWFLTKKILHYKNSKLEKEPINKIFLDLSPTNTNLDNIDFIDIKVNKIQYYRFSFNEILQLFNYALYNQEESIPNPFIPKNPYTGTPFHLHDIVKIFYIFRNKKWSIIMNLFKQSSFDLDCMNKIHKIFLINKASKHYVENLEDNLFKRLFKEFYDITLMKSYACKKCIYNLSNFREDYTPVLTKYIFESNIKFNSDFVLTDHTANNSVNMSLKLIDYYNITSSRSHPLKHRKILKVTKKPTFVFNPPTL